MLSDLFGIGVVGYGYWGPNLARNFAAQPGGRLVAICDRDPKRLAQAALAHPSAETTPDYEALLRNPEIHAIAIATPVSHHFALAKAALLAGKDVFVEKPFTQTSAQGQELVTLAERKGRIIAVDHTFLYTGAVRKIKELVDAHALGDLLYFDSVRINLGLFQQDVDVVYDLAPHDLSILMHLVGNAPVCVRAMGARYGNNPQDCLAYLHLEYANGFVAHFHFSWLAPVKIRKTVIAGTDKMVVYDDLEQSEKVKIYDKGITIKSDADSVAKVKVDYRTGDMLAPKLEHREALAAEAAHFLQCVRDRETPLADGRAGLAVVRIIEAAEKSLREGGSRAQIAQG